MKRGACIVQVYGRSSSGRRGMSSSQDDDDDDDDDAMDQDEEDEDDDDEGEAALHLLRWQQYAQVHPAPLTSSSACHAPLTMAVCVSLSSAPRRPSLWPAMPACASPVEPLHLRSLQSPPPPSRPRPYRHAALRPPSPCCSKRPPMTTRYVTWLES